MRLIDADPLYEKVQHNEELARNRVLDTESTLPYPNNLNPSYTRYVAQMNERTQFKHMIADAPTVPQWIPCSERLPEEDGGLYLVTDYAKSINRRRMHLSRCYMNKDGFWSDVPIGYKVIAWMPLPEPYSERREE